MIPSKTIILDPSHQAHSLDALSIPSPSLHDAANWATLYPELIYEILTYCLSGVTLSTCAPWSFPWYLGHICQSWRSVFISSPRFWDHFSFGSHRLEKTNLLQRALALVELCIERTKEHPFSFKFMDAPHAEVSFSFQILETLVAHADRWRAACLRGHEDYINESLTKAKGRLGQLNSLQISHFWRSSSSNDANPRTPSDVFQDAPNLTRVWARDYYQLPWSTLVVLHVDEPHSASRFFENLDKMTCLEELVISGFHVHHNVANTSPIELPSLQKLSVNNFPPGLHIKTPALERLYLGSALRAGLHTAITLLRGVSHLTTLSFDVGHVHDARVMEWALELDHLILSCDNYTPIEAFKSLLQSPASHSTVYSLRRISISIRDLKAGLSGPSIWIMHTLWTVLKSWRKDQFPKLRSVSVYVKDERNEGIASAIADLMRVGVDKGVEIDVNFSLLPTRLAFW